ncbi:MAG: Asp-tRNA(Asn)/Glu-tRNA(Gln) amidotransferase subunit GatC [Deltaproteobacteria bacterium]|nr:Asp-tRNA(Asn)/Glu-tRNA(Gln) amidotransferase subunit GatC [Deltaproteobacteria bacterium]
MSAPRPDVVHLARLARLALPPDELAHIERDLQRILDYVSQLEAVDVTGVPPLVHPLPFEAPARADVPEPALPREVALASAPEHDDEAFLVTRVL